MTIAKSGDTVKVHYVGRLDDGSVFDSSQGREPLVFTLGEGSVIQGFDTIVLGMGVGQKKSARLEPEEAYGPMVKELFLVVNRDQFPPDIVPQVGMKLTLSNDQGEATLVSVFSVEGDEVTLDANHPLAGKALTFEVELVEIVGEAA
ncbi:MAG: peptidylprolyl isomerase [Myxococcales bacterium]|nr:MAG: peptidylprolyl isomerase [Myxococcales bacterium]